MSILSDEVPTKLDHRSLALAFCQLCMLFFCDDVVCFTAAGEFGKHGSDAQSRRGGSKNFVSFKVEKAMKYYVHAHYVITGSSTG